MMTILHLCFSWTFIAALGLVLVIAFLDLLYDDEKSKTFCYPTHPCLQIAVFLLLFAVFVLWQMPISFESEYLIEVLLVRLGIIVAWFFIAKFLIKWLIYGMVMLAIRSFIKACEKKFSA